MHICGDVLYLLAHTISLHGFIVEWMVRLFGRVEGDCLRYYSNAAARVAASVKQPHWAAFVVNAVIIEEAELNGQ